MTPQTRQTTIGTNGPDSTPRLWLEGQWLLQAGFVPGQGFQVFYDSDTILITAVSPVTGPDPTVRVRRISGKAKAGIKVPVLDINGSKVAWTGPSTVTIQAPGMLIVTKGV